MSTYKGNPEVTGYVTPDGEYPPLNHRGVYLEDLFVDGKKYGQLTIQGDGRIIGSLLLWDATDEELDIAYDIIGKRNREWLAKQTG